MNNDSAVLLQSPSSLAAALGSAVNRVFAGYPGSLALRLWNGETIFVGGSVPQFTLVLNAPAALRHLILRRDPLQLAHAYFAGHVDVEGDLYCALALRDNLGKQSLRWHDRLALLPKLLSMRSTAAGSLARGTGVVRQSPLDQTRRSNSREQNELAIGFHYDVPSDFYQTWLDRQMVYSCAYFEREDEGLDSAQAGKLNHICRKLRLKPGDRFLDIGCGWGALALWAVRHFGVHATGVTISKRQFEWARRRVREEGLRDRVSIELCDYRDIAGAERFDRIASVGMFEHVGLKNLSTYFDTAHRLLKPGGLFLNHGITHDEEGWNKSLSTRFINRYVFPDGELDTVSNVQRRMEQAQFEIWDVEALRPHYALTLRHWVARLEAAREAALRHVDEATYRVWRLYMAGSALHFENGDIGVYQVLASKRSPGVAPLPLTRRDLYC
jgi:cyclopropane-fatty-acyl-phospholipid synthase